jgi:hypothetical protein
MGSRPATNTSSPLSPPPPPCRVYWGEGGMAQEQGRRRVGMGMVVVVLVVVLVGCPRSRKFKGYGWCMVGGRDGGGEECVFL